VFAECHRRSVISWSLHHSYLLRDHQIRGIKCWLYLLNWPHWPYGLCYYLLINRIFLKLGDARFISFWRTLRKSFSLDSIMITLSRLLRCPLWTSKKKFVIISLVKTDFIGYITDPYLACHYPVFALGFKYSQYFLGFFTSAGHSFSITHVVSFDLAADQRKCGVTAT